MSGFGYLMNIISVIIITVENVVRLKKYRRLTMNVENFNEKYDREWNKQWKFTSTLNLIIGLKC